MKQIISQIINTITNYENILVMPSSPPDGDSLGSAMALYLVLKKLHKSVTVVCADPIPDVYEFLPHINNIDNKFSPSPDFIVTIDTKDAEIASLQSQVEENKFNIILTPKKGQFSAKNISFSHGPHRYDLIITVDTAALHQLGRFYEDNIPIFSEVPVINIDHHASNENFGRLNFIDIMSSSTAELVLEVLEALEQQSGSALIDADIATALLSGIITDTGSFQHTNTTPHSFSNSAKLIRHGARQQEIIQHVYKTKQLSTLRLWGKILTSIVVDHQHRLLWSKITQKDLRETDSKSEESGAIIDELMSNAPDVDVIILLKEKEGILSGSVRTLSDAVDASEIAAIFDGGGHARAAGFKIKTTDFIKSVNEVIEKISEYQAKRLNNTHQPYQSDGNPNEQINLEAETKQVSIPKENSSIESKSISPKGEIVISQKDSNPQDLKPGILYQFEK